MILRFSPLLLLLACYPKSEEETETRGAGTDSGDTAAHDTGEPAGDDTAGETAESGDSGECVASAEVCDGVDNDCDGEIDEEGGEVWYPDHDGDGYGVDDGAVTACEPPPGSADNPDDCDDTNAAVHPDRDDPANSTDDNCDGNVDEDAVFVVDVAWSDWGVTITIEGSAPGYDFGMAETGVGSAGWYGESCIPGDEPRGYDDYGYDLCHGLTSTGGRFESVYPDIGAVTDFYTLFNVDIGESGNLTYFLGDVDSTDCWVWGDDPSYYAEFGCSVL